MLLHKFHHQFNCSFINGDERINKVGKGVSSANLAMLSEHTVYSLNTI